MEGGWCAVWSIALLRRKEGRKRIKNSPRILGVENGMFSHWPRKCEKMMAVGSLVSKRISNSVDADTNHQELNWESKRRDEFRLSLRSQNSNCDNQVVGSG